MTIDKGRMIQIYMAALQGACNELSELTGEPFAVLMERLTRKGVKFVQAGDMTLAPPKFVKEDNT